MIILDTNVLSEMMRPSPSRQVLEWLAREPPLGVFTTTITQAEILYGIELVAGGRRRVALDAAAEAMFREDFAGRILPFDDEAARVFPKIAAARRLLGRPISQFDAQIAAIARSRGAAIATRNTMDFDDCGLAGAGRITGQPPGGAGRRSGRAAQPPGQRPVAHLLSLEARRGA